ncbi:hypothetical protein J2S41_006911 [Catenuloplanes atrovinosus]|uniref:Uncharacterized protein n=1 Tax=Catenuloplanes atrovinosus TaxID=137266 RepID=A0AAE3YUH4_9ACTN|nr:hypothetical protein [Catenuloplanes atrovinosus]
MDVLPERWLGPHAELRFNRANEMDSAQVVARSARHLDPAGELTPLIAQKG